MNKPKYKTQDGDFCAIVRVDFIVIFRDIVIATAMTLNEKKEPNKKNIWKMLRTIIRNDGEGFNMQGLSTQGLDFDTSALEEKAETIAKKLFPKWIQNDNQC